MTVLVTGSSGFVGSRIAARLVDAGAAVRGAVRPGSRPLDRRVQTIPISDIGPMTDWGAALCDVTAVIHAAAHVHRAGEPVDLAERRHREINADGTRRLASAAAAAGVSRFVLISTVKVLGERSAARPLDDSTQPAPMDAYARSKLEAEQHLFAAAQDGAMEAVALRPPLVYGPGVKANFLALLKLCALPVPLPLGAMTNRRSLIYVDNLADAAIAAVAAPNVAGRSFVVDDGAPVSTADLVRTIRHALGRSAWLLALPPPVVRWCLDVVGRGGLFDRLAGDLEVDSSGYRAAAGWTPPISFAAGIAETVRWFRATRTT